MSEIQYISLYDYLGRSTAQNQEGIRVAKIADEKGIKPKYKMLPEAYISVPLLAVKSIPACSLMIL